MRPFTELTARGQVARLRALARRALARFGLPTDGPLDLLGHAENTTFRVRHGGAWFMLRVHRLKYHDAPEIESELAWLDALSRETDLAVPRPVPAPDGARLIAVEAPGLDRPRHCVLLRWVHGRFRRRPPDGEWMARVGALTATLHAQVERWSPPAGFVRPHWDARGLVGPGSFWGDVTTLPGLSDEQQARLRALAARVRAALDAYGTGPDRYGLIHGDLHAHNVLARGERAHPIDFDDCGYGWHVYDMAVTLNTLRQRDDFPALMAGWLRGYRSIRPLGDAHLALFEPLSAARQINVGAWVATRGEIPEVRAYTPFMIERLMWECDRNG